jgi:serine/threonine protein phosphatase PrpC
MIADETWRIIGETQQGASHVFLGTPNQDDIDWDKEDDPFPWAVIAVADGHGSPKCFRSKRGASLAVDIAVKVGREFLMSQIKEPNRPLVKSLAEEKLPRLILDRWLQEVERDCVRQPFSAEELSALDSRENQVARKAVEERPALAYGTTLITCLFTTGFVIYLQIGDGDILSVSSEGEVSRPFPADPRLFANETTSLSSKDALRDFRFGFQVISGRPPALTLLSTDGYSNAFRDNDGFLKVGSDLLDIIRTDGPGQVEQYLPTWLNEATETGSGDDVTLGLVIWEEVVARVPRGTAEGDVDRAHHE